MKNSIYDDIKDYYAFQDRVVPYLVVGMVAIAIPLAIYSYFNLFTLHTQEVQVYCEAEYEHLGVSNTRQIENLKLYLYNPEKFSELRESQQKEFYKDTVRLSECQLGYMFSEEVKGARKVNFINKYTKNSSTAYILDEFIIPLT